MEQHLKHDPDKVSSDSDLVLDSGTNIHLFTHSDARRFFNALRKTHMSVVGISGISEKCSNEGRITLVVRDNTGKLLNLSLGIGYSTKSTPRSLISISRLLKEGTRFHFEKGNCYLETDTKQRIDIIERNGLFLIPAAAMLKSAVETTVSEDANQGSSPPASFVGFASEAKDHDGNSTDNTAEANKTSEPEADGFAGSAFGTPKVWHDRFAHMLQMDALKRINRDNLVHGLAVKGEIKTANCPCTTCQLVKINRKGRKVRKSAMKASIPGEVVSMDIKHMSTKALGGYKYLLCFVDHASKFCMDIPLKDKSSETVVDAVRKFVQFMHEHHYAVSNIQTDRGSEFFGYQDGELKEEDLTQHEKESLFGKFSGALKELHINHTVIPTESHEKHAEAHFAWLSKAIDSQLYEARLSPVFWADAAIYACYLHNRIPCLNHNDHSTPYTRLTGNATDWGHIRKFGSSCVWKLPNDKLAKYPGIPRGKHMIFVGFSDISSGWKLFDPIERKYISGAEHVNFYEDMTARQCSLRNFDRRRKIQKAKEQQPLIIDDNEISDSDRLSIESVRNLYIDPEEVDVKPVMPISAIDLEGYLEEKNIDPLSIDQKHKKTIEAIHKAVSPNSAQNSDDLHEKKMIQLKQKLTQKAKRKASKMAEIDGRTPRRPLRLSAIGVKQALSSADKDFISMAKKYDFEVKYQQKNPKIRGKEEEGKLSWRLYEKFKIATNIREALELGATMDRVYDDYAKGYIRFPGRESKEPGHVFMASAEVATDLVSLLGMDRDISIEECGEEFAAALDKAASAADKVSISTRMSFSEAVANCHDPEPMIRLVEDKKYRELFSEEHGLRLMCTSSAANFVNIDYSLQPEPDYYQSLKEQGCPEHHQWLEARKEETESMEKFKVWRRVKRSEARGHKLLTSKWVHKRKTNERGEVSRYKARLVARGFTQIEYDSFHPDEVFAHVVDRNSMRTVLSLAASQNLKLYSFDISNAYLQAELKEVIYMEPPPGMDIPKDECLALIRPIYGTRQGARMFSDALDSHLEKIGFKQNVADPCVWTRTRNGKQQIITSYVDDCTVAVADDKARDDLMVEMRDRFEIKEGEGEPINYLLGILIQQDLEAGTVTLTQELAATKLADAFLTEEEKVKAKSVNHPMLHSVVLPRLKEKEVPKEKFNYLSAIGSLLYLSGCTRPDIAAATGILARHGATPGAVHVKAVKRLIQYVYNTRKYGIQYKRNSDMETDLPKIYGQGRHPKDNGKNHMTVFTDSDYAADESKRSTQGSIVFMNGGPISWSSVLGKTICLSTCEAEVMAAVAASKEAIHLKLLLGELGVNHEKLIIEEDNSACIAQAKGGLRFIRKAKHYQIALRYIQKLHVDGEVDFNYCETSEQIADLFTKALDEPKFTYFRDKIMHLSA